jgi:hypothetical protein
MAPNYEQRIKPVDLDRFHFALGVFGAAAAMKGPYPNPEQYSLTIVDTDCSATQVRFTDRPETRGIIALKKEFPEADELECISFRILTMPEIIRYQKLVSMGLVRNGDNGELEVHDAVINALAKAPFRKSRRLDKSAFLTLVKSEYERLEATEISEGSQLSKQ